MRLLLLIVALGLLAGGARAQQYAFRHYGAEAGLARAFAVAVDGTGAVVAGTGEGLFRFDGRAFEPVAVPGGEQLVSKLTASPDGSLWGASDAGSLFRLDADGFPEAVPVPAALRAGLTRPDHRTRLRTDVRNRLWLNPPDSLLWRFDASAGTWSRFAPPVAGERLTDFYWAGDTLVFAAGRRVGRVRYRDGTPGSVAWLYEADSPVFFVRPNPHHHAWVSTGAGLFLLRRDGTAARLDTYGSWRYTEPAVDATGRLLTSIDGAGGVVTHLFGPEGEEVLRAGPAEGLDALPLHYTFDAEGGLWIAAGSGLAFLGSRHLVAFPLRAPGGEAQYVHRLVGNPSQGPLLAATWAGLYRLEGGRFARVDERTEIVSTPVLDRDGSAWWREVFGGRWVLRSGRPEPLGARPSLLHDGRDGTRLWWDDGVLLRERAGRTARLADGYPWVEQTAEGGRDLIWLLRDDGTLDLAVGDSLASACRACVAPSLRAVLDDLRGPRRLLGVAVDAFGRLWGWSIQTGLVVLYHEREGTWARRRFGPADGFPSTEVSVAFPTPDGRLWVGTGRGLQGFRLRADAPTLEPLLDLRASDGIEGGTVTAVVEDSEGRVWFHTIAGKVHRLDWRRMERPPSPALRPAALEVEGERRRPGPALHLRTADRLSVRLAPATYRQPERVRVEYRLAGRDTAWTSLGSTRAVSFAELPAGRYAFEARAVREGQPPGPVLRQALVVVPPFYRTGWFAALALLALGGLLAAGYRVRMAQVRIHNEQLRAEVARQTHALTAANARLHEVDRRRREFFANVSHEFRTPLTLILGPLEDLRERLGEPDVEARRAETIAAVEVARHNARRLLRLINQLLDAARIEAGAMRLSPRPLDLARLVREVGEAFEGLAERRRVTFRVEGAGDPLPAFLDADAVEKVLANLLSNAFKFTPEGGAVALRLAREARDGRGVAAVSVRDSGPGIAAEALPHVFDRFYRADERGGVGTGIGLALARELAELHGGAVEVESAAGAGSTFTFVLPLETPADGAVPEHPVPATAPAEVGDAVAVLEPPATAEPDGLGGGDGAAPEAEAAEDDRPLVLVADDNAQIRAYVRRHLGEHYRIAEAADGAEALALARAHPPDLVLSDVLMPGMDGVALCRTLKADPETDFVPVVLLTAKASPEHRVEGLGVGADDYLAKPFDVAELRARVENLIAGRQRLRDRLVQEVAGAAAPASGAVKLHAAPVSAVSADDAFLERVRETVEAHMGDAAFGVEALAREVGLSRAHLFRRLRDLCGETPTALLLRMRLERAAALLRARAGTVSEVAYGVGFRSVSYFSKAFRAHFGATPSAYAAGEDGAC